MLLIDCYKGAEWSQRILAEYERQIGAPLEGMDFFHAYACGWIGYNGNAFVETAGIFSGG
jgi:hypothetical protein